MLIFFLAVSANGVSADESLKIGYVNPGRVSDEAPQADAAREQLQEEFAPRDEEILSMQDSLRALEDRLAEQRLSLAQDEQEEMQQQIVVQRRQIQRQQEAFREDFNMRRNEALGDLQRRILRVVSEFAEEQGFDLVVSDGVVYASDQVNITDRIIQRLQRQYERDQGAE
ncbi:MAG: OmpH family outer membrane protein [Spiribacter salinus]|uniref:OmpH family outer membrane protein n=1 Tax=Spiribacter salinus TaxID=1335746 RepID=A0A540VUE0_9GAMM|nr:MAG: OmpH family outer membrane protein [Spiribacter salinus]